VGDTEVVDRTASIGVASSPWVAGEDIDLALEAFNP